MSPNEGSNSGMFTSLFLNLKYNNILMSSSDFPQKVKMQNRQKHYCERDVSLTL